MASKRIARKVTPGPSKKVASTPSTDEDVDYEEPVATNGEAPVTKAPRPAEHDDVEIRGGWGASQEIIDSTSSYAQAFRPTTDTQVIKFLDAVPYASFRRHWIDRVGIGRRAYTCLESVGKSCPLCDVGDKPSAVTAFNIALLSDDGVATVKSWDCAVKLTQQLKTYHHDPKIGPLDKPTLYFTVSKTETKQRQQASTMVNPVRERDLKEDWGTPPLTEAQLEKLLANQYTPAILTLPSKHELEEIAAEFVGDEEQPSWGK